MLIGLTGRKQAGKDTVYARAAHVMADVMPVERASFADLLYRSAAAALGITEEQLREWKNTPLALVVVLDPEGNEVARHTIREFLQRYGTEAHREVFGNDFWVEQVRLYHEGRIVFVTDVRFKNEALAVRAAGGIVVRVLGPAEVERDGDGHASEAQLAPGLIDATIHNSRRGDHFRSLDAQVDTLLRLALKGVLTGCCLPNGGNCADCGMREPCDGCVREYAECCGRRQRLTELTRLSQEMPGGYR